MKAFMPHAAPPVAWDYPNPFTLRLAPQVADIDGLHHTNNAVYVRWCEQLAWAHSQQLGLELADYARLNRAMTIRRSEYDYLQPTLLGEEVELGTWLTASDGKLTMIRQFQLVRMRDHVTLMRARWELICIALDSGRVRRMPTEFSDIYSAAVMNQET